MKCPNCGKEIANDSNFCEHCGTQSLEYQKQKQEYEIKKKKRLKTVSVAISVLLLLGIVISLGIFAKDRYGAYKAWASDGCSYMNASNWVNARLSYEKALAYENDYKLLFKVFGLSNLHMEDSIVKIDLQLTYNDRNDYLQTISMGDDYLKKNKMISAKTEYEKALEIEKKYSNTSNAYLFDRNIQEKISALEIKIKEEKELYNGHQYVDLGLSVKWATCNVGASRPENYGNSYAWGELKKKKEYTEKNNSTYGKKMNDISASSQYDVARNAWGGKWRIPTKSEMEELKNKCTWTWTTRGGCKGYKVTGPNGNSIFLPAAGYREMSSLFIDGKGGYYWTSSPGDYSINKVYCLNFSVDKRNVAITNQYYGQSIRPVVE